MSTFYVIQFQDRGVWLDHTVTSFNDAWVEHYANIDSAVADRDWCAESRPCIQWRVVKRTVTEEVVA